MYQKKQYVQNVVVFFADMFAVFCSYLFANLFWLVKIKGIRLMVEAEPVNSLGIVFISAAVAFFVFTGSKPFIQRTLLEEEFHCLKVNLVFAGIYSVMLFVSRGANEASRGVFAFTVAFNVVIMSVFHMFIRVYLFKVYKNKKKNSQLLIITIADRADKVIRDMGRNIEWSNRIRGMAVIDKDMVGEVIDNVNIVATAEDIVEYAKEQIVDEVFIDVPSNFNKEVQPLVMEFEDMGVTVHINLDMLDNFKDFNKHISLLGDMPVLTFASNFFDDNKLIIKRLIDIVGSIIGIAVTLVVTVFVGPAILIESRGPLIFRQKRVGKNGRYFYLYKFRSMYKDAEERKKALMEKNEMDGLMFKMTDDPRITKVGKFIRKTSIDELPQFFNVLKGDMSLVGTRPPTVDEFKQYEGHHKRRLSMKPGITGMWQVSGRSNITSFEDVVNLDLEYIDNWSIGLDMKILFKTVGAVFKSNGAK